MSEIPSPPGLPLIGNVRDVDPAEPSISANRLFSQYGRILRLRFPGTSRVLIGSYDVLNEVCDEKRFHKVPQGPLYEVRSGVGDGLFTAFGDEENWGLAHRILMPAFGPMAMTRYFDEMHSVACELVTKWARLGPDNLIDPTDQFTRFTLDSIALCAMDTRFNSFDRDSLHPFVHAMTFFLKESGIRSQRPKVLSDYVYRQDTRKYNESIEIMRQTALAVIKQRRENPIQKADLLSAMLEGKDPKTGKGLPESNIVNNMITFLIAGHETTSGLLSFLFVKLIQNPRVMAKLQKEVHDVLGDQTITADVINKFPYLTACIRETLRLHPTAVGFQVSPISQNSADYPMRIGKEGWLVNKDDVLGVSLTWAQSDPAIWGEDALEFKPERMVDELFNKLPPNAWKPFGNGARACIGRAFAWQEAHMITAMLLQNFDFRAEDPSYKLEIAQTLTIKPKGFLLHAVLKQGLDISALERRLWGGKAISKAPTHKDLEIEKAAKDAVKKTPMSIFYGSNTGTCEALAQSLASTASSRGYLAKVEPLDAATKALPTGVPVAIITASYEGEPPDNAGRFVDWLSSLSDGAANAVKYSVFGCGHSDWASTYQRIPTLCDDLLHARGGTRLCPRGFANAAENDIFNSFDTWSDEVFWPSLTSELDSEGYHGSDSPGIDVELSTSSRTSDLRQDVAEGLVTKAFTLTAEDQPEKRHIEVQLPSGMSYNAGDYLAVLPINRDQLVKTIMARFNIPWDARCRIGEGQPTFLPTGRFLPVYGILGAYVELNHPATKKNVQHLAHFATAQVDRTALNDLTSADIAEKHISVLDLVERYKSVEIPFGDFLAMLPPMRVRQYSISSSPIGDAERCTLTYGVLDQEAKIGGKRYQGTCSTYLSELAPGDKVYCAVRPSHQAFHLPLDAEKVPIVMACAGSGLAPFHGFVQERAKQMESGRQLAPALLFVGCRHPQKDALYTEDFALWTKLGAVDIRYAFSKAPEKSGGSKYVQDRLWQDRAEAALLWEQGAKFFVCGNNSVGEGVKEVVIKTALERSEAKGEMRSREQVEAWFSSIRNERYASDVFA